MIQNNLTIILVAYKPKTELLESLILKFRDKYPIIITNNSEEKLKDFFYQLENVHVIDAKKNLGNGAGINLCLDHCKTDYALYLDIDVVLDHENFLKLLNYRNQIKDFAVLVPNGQNIKSKDEISKRWDVEGSIMLINKKLVHNVVRFDENYFLYYEELDFFFNCIKNNINVYFLSKVTFTHKRASSIETANNHQFEKLYLLRQWHLSWSNYYFHRKNFNKFIALKKNLPSLLKDIVKLIYFFFILDFKSFKIRFTRISGLACSFLNFSSYKRL